MPASDTGVARMKSVAARKSEGIRERKEGSEEGRKEERRGGGSLLLFFFFFFLFRLEGAVVNRTESAVSWKRGLL